MSDMHTYRKVGDDWITLREYRKRQKEAAGAKGDAPATIIQPTGQVIWSVDPKHFKHHDPKTGQGILTSMSEARDIQKKLGIVWKP